MIVRSQLNDTSRRSSITPMSAPHHHVVSPRVTRRQHSVVGLHVHPRRRNEGGKTLEPLAIVCSHLHPRVQGEIDAEPKVRIRRGLRSGTS